MTQLKAAIMAIALFFSIMVPAYAEHTVTKAAVVRMISKETKDTVRMPDIIRMVNAVFSESRKHDMDPRLMFSVIKKESRYNPRAKNRSGARGLTQVIPRWHKKKIKGRNIMHIETNIEVGTKIMADCLQNNNGIIKKAFRCYSGGAKNYTTGIKANYAAIQQAEIVYRFENELAIDKSPSLEESISTLSISLKAKPELAQQKEQLQVAFNETKNDPLY